MDGLAIPVLREAVATRMKMLDSYTREELGGLGSALDLVSFLLLNAISYHTDEYDALLRAKEPPKRTAFRAYETKAMIKHRRWLRLEYILYCKRVGRLSEATRIQVVKKFLKLRWLREGIPFELGYLLMRGVSPPAFQFWSEERKELVRMPKHWRAPPGSVTLKRGTIQTTLEELTTGLSVDHMILLASFWPLCYARNQHQIVNQLLPWIARSWQIRGETVPRSLWSMQSLAEAEEKVTGGIPAARIPDWAKPPCIRSIEHSPRHPSFARRALHTFYYAKVTNHDPECAQFIVDRYWRPACERDGKMQLLSSMEAEAKSWLNGPCAHGCRDTIQKGLCVWADANNQLRDIEDIVVKQPLQQLGYSIQIQEDSVQSIRENGRWATGRCGLLQRILAGSRPVRQKIFAPAHFTQGLLLSATPNVKV